MYKIENNYNADTYFCADYNKLFKIVKELMRVGQDCSIFINTSGGNEKARNKTTNFIYFDKDFIREVIDDEMVTEAIELSTEMYKQTTLIFN